MRYSRIIIALVAVPASAVIARAQTTDTLSLAGKSYFSASVALNGHDVATNDQHGQDARLRHVAAFGFTHFARSSVAVEIAAASLGADATNSFTGQHANTVGSLLFGLSYSPRELALSQSVRPFVSAMIGPYINTIADNTAAGRSAQTQSAFGSRLGAGMNWFFSRHFMANVMGEYRAVSRFDRPELLPVDPNGFSVSLGFGVGWGGR